MVLPSTPSIPSLPEYYDMLNAHDWYHMMSDDHSVWRRGQTSLDRLRTIARQTEEHSDLFAQFEQHHFSGPAFNTEKTPKPERPVED